jgi:hypothetical protein
LADTLLQKSDELIWAVGYSMIAAINLMELDSHDLQQFQILHSLESSLMKLPTRAVHHDAQLVSTTASLSANAQAPQVPILSFAEQSDLATRKTACNDHKVGAVHATDQIEPHDDLRVPTQASLSQRCAIRPGEIPDHYDEPMHDDDCVCQTDVQNVLMWAFHCSVRHARQVIHRADNHVDAFH